MPLQGQLGHLEEGVLHGGAVDSRGWRAPERFPQRRLHPRKSLVVVHRPCIPAHVLCQVRHALAITSALLLVCNICQTVILWGIIPGKWAALVRAFAMQKCILIQTDNMYKHAVKQGSYKEGVQRDWVTSRWL